MLSNNHSLVLPFVEESTRKFVNVGPMQEVLSLSIVSGRPVIMYGAGGHGKSEFTRMVFDCVEGAETYVLPMNGSTEEHDLYGGIDLGAINDPDDPRIEFNTERSFLAFPLVIFEEMLDAPAKVLASLKNTLTERQLQNGVQVANMDSLVLVGLTNKKPSDVVEATDEVSRNAIAALMERFPLQVIVEWQSYDARDYMEMFQTIVANGDGCGEFTLEELIDLRELAQYVTVSEDVASVLTELVAEANEQAPNPLSPRTFMYAVELIRAAAAINGRDHAIEQDIVSVKYLPGMEGIAETIESKISAASDRAKAEGLLTDGFRIVSLLGAQLERRLGNFQFMLGVMALLRVLEDEVDDMIRPPQELRDRKQALIDQVRSVFKSTGVSSDYIGQAQVVLPEQMLGVSWKVKVEKSDITLAEQLRQKEELERLAEYEAESGYGYSDEDEWEEDYHDDDEWDEEDDVVAGDEVLNRLRNRQDSSDSDDWRNKLGSK